MKLKREEHKKKLENLENLKTKAEKQFEKRTKLFNYNLQIEYQGTALLSLIFSICKSSTVSKSYVYILLFLRLLVPYFLRWKESGWTKFEIENEDVIGFLVC